MFHPTFPIALGGRLETNEASSVVRVQPQQPGGGGDIGGVMDGHWDQDSRHHADHTAHSALCRGILDCSVILLASDALIYLVKEQRIKIQF